MAPEAARSARLNARPAARGRLVPQAARLAAPFLGALAICSAAPAHAAGGDLAASVHPSFLPDALGARTAFTFAFRLQVAEEGVPPPLRRMVVHLPAGLGVNLDGVPACGVGRLRRSGPRGCPPRSLIGRGHATLEVHAGSQAIPEQALAWALRIPDRGGRPALALFTRGTTPLQQQAISTATLSPDGPPYGLKITVAIPAIRTVVYEPDASITSFSLTLGAVGTTPRAHAAAGAVTVPRRCPAGGFPFAADFSFADYTTSRATARVPCP
ncbi:MAG: hypothetical protein JWL67_112 [Solirubrobacterales bacterium]|nr:hypothetical protein [Solirubrobacterales bacterium]